MVKKNKICNLLRASETSSRLGGLKRHPEYNDLVHITSFLPNNASVSQRLWHVNNDNYNIPTCLLCNSTVPWNKERGGSYRSYCSRGCAGRSTIRQEKIKETNIKKYQSPSPLGNKEVRAKGTQTMQTRYGVDHNTHHPEMHERMIAAAIKSKNKHIGCGAEIDDMIAKRYTQTQIGNELGISQPRVHKLLIRLNKKTITPLVSHEQREVTEFVQSICNHTIITNDKSTIPPLELDLLIPSLNIGIEVNGVYWHSDLSGKGRQYHNTKTRNCHDAGIQLIHISSADWISRQDIVKSRLRTILKTQQNRLYARSCTVQELSCSVVNDFVDHNHLQGKRNARVNLGLYHGDQLVAIASFSSHRKYEYEWIRMCSLCGVNVIGGAGKLFTYFVRNWKPTTVMSFADRQWGTGQVYNELGFAFEEVTPPNYRYFKRNGNTNVLMSRMQFQKHKLSYTLENFDPHLTEWNNMVIAGYDRIWDCGSVKWVWSVD